MAAIDKIYVVLILVLVEDGLGEAKTIRKWPNTFVLILVLVEDGLGEAHKKIIDRMVKVS